MKKQLLLLSIAVITFIVLPMHNVVAQDATPSATPTAASAQLEELKVRLATKVAELRSVVKRAMYGTVKSVSLTSATVETKTKDIKIELTDDVTVSQVVSGKRVNLDAEDLEVDDPITVFGTYDETLDLLKAQYIFIESATSYTRVAGIVADVDDEDFVLTVNVSDGRSILVDIERTTKTSEWTKENGVAKSGFSKISVGDTVHVTGTPAAKEDNRLTAVRILDLGNITGSAGTPTTTTAVTPAASRSATPRATPRPTATPTTTP